jgi:histone acetyltransferase (RNA polymerase elongator complex component)
MSEKYFKELVSIIKKLKPSKDQLSKIKIKLCKKHNLKKIPTDIEVLLSIKKKEIPIIKKYLLVGFVRRYFFIIGISFFLILNRTSISV